MSTPYALDDHFPGDGCGYEHGDGSDEFWSDPETDIYDDPETDIYDDPETDIYDDPETDIYDDPYDVVMYDIDPEPDDLYALIEMLSDSARSWYASRRLNALSAAGPLSALVADSIVDSLGRRWDPLQHPRDRFGKFIQTGGFIRWLMGGANLRGQVSRIDSNGNIHVRSVGNDHIPDGTVIQFKPEQASKLISIANPLADLSNLHLPSAHSIPGINEPNLSEPGPHLPDIPGFPGASDAQKRIYDTLQHGDMPAVDLDKAIHTDQSGGNFASEVLGLQKKGLIQIDSTGSVPIVRRTDGSANVINFKDNQLDPIPDGVGPDLGGLALTQAQRNLFDRIIYADKNQNDGVRQGELSNVDGHDFQALIDAGVLVQGDNGNFFLHNPTNDNSKADLNAPTPDLSAEISAAAAKVLDDPLAQEAFQHYAEELARPGDPANAVLPDGLSPAKRRTAETAANKWWADRNANTPGDGNSSADANVPAVDKPNPKDALNPRNQAMADQLMAQWFPDSQFSNYLDTPEGADYRGAIKRLFDAQDLQDNGFDVQAGVERDKANLAMERVGVSPEDIAGWPIEVQNVRNAANEQSVPGNAPSVANDSAAKGVDWAGAPLQSNDSLLNPDGSANVPSAPNVTPTPPTPDASLQQSADEFKGTPVDGVWNADQMNAGAEVLQAMKDVQAGKIYQDQAYEIAAGKVRDGILKQEDLNFIQDQAAKDLGSNWANDLAIDHVGNDQFGVNLGKSPDVSQIPSAQPSDALVPLDGSPEHSRVVNQPGLDFVDTSNLSPDGHALDKNGQLVQVGNWYRADAGGEGDPGQMVGFYDQQKYPGLVALVMPDGKVKGVFAKGQNRITAKEADNWRAQRAVRNRDQGTIGKGMPELDQFHRMLQIKDANDPNGPPIQAKLGQRIVSNSGGKKFPRGEEGVIVRFGWDGAKGRPIIFVVRPGAQNQRDEIGLAPKAVQFHADTPVPSFHEPTPGPNLPNLPNLDPNNLPSREWPVPADSALIDQVRGLGGEADLVRFANAYQAPGVVYDQIQSLIKNGDLEMVPGNADARPRVRIPGGNGGAPALPDGATNEFEGAVLNAIDGAGGGGLQKADIVNIDHTNAGEQLLALRALADRGVIRERTDSGGGHPFFERVVATPEPTKVNGAQNTLESDLLNAVDAKGTGGAVGGDLVDVNATDAADRMFALRGLVDRGVLRRENGADGRPIFRRTTTSEAGAPVVMDDTQAVKALAGGADPLSIVNSNLARIMDKAGFERKKHFSAGISNNYWIVSPNNAEFSIDLHGNGVQNGHVYMVKSSSGQIHNDVLNEIMAGAISDDIAAIVGADSPGVMHHPSVRVAEAPHGVGNSAGGAILMDHAAYGFPKGHKIFGGGDLSDRALQDGGASHDIIGLGLYDYMINNTIDRHRGNQMFVQDPTTGKISVVIIDNGFGFGAPERGAMPGKDLKFDRYANSGQPKALFRRADRTNQIEVEKAVQDFVDSYKNMEVSSVMSRIKAMFPTMSPDQEAYARQWLEMSKSRVDAMSLDIRGVVNAIMGL